MKDLVIHFRRLEERLFQPEVRHSRQELENLLSREFREIGSSGRLYTFSDTIEGLLAESPDGSSRAEDFELQMLADGLALVTYRSVRSLFAGGQKQNRRSSIWRLETDGQWRMLFHQGTPLP
ncbi:nuclear transport factor 2 family protein [Rhizobium binxianense]